MIEVEIRPGGKLFNTIENREITDQAVCYLFYDCTLASDVTLLDIFLLLNTNLEIFSAIFGNWCREIVKEGLQDPEPRDGSKIDYLQLYWSLDVCRDFKTNQQLLTGYQFPHFHGVGVSVNGKINNYSLAISKANNLANLSLRTKDEFRIYPEFGVKSEKSIIFEKGIFTLSHILQGILRELTFHGSPKMRDAFSEKLISRIKNLDPEKFIPFEKVMDDLRKKI